MQMHSLTPLTPLLVAIAVVMPVNASGFIPEPQGYRMGEYRTPTPATLAGATVVDSIELYALMQENKQTVLIDVLPLERKPPDFPPDRLWRTPPRYNLPGSVWLPNVGDGPISPLFKKYLIENLEKIVAGKDNPPLVFYCLMDCWMSWNAAKRALELGYHNVYWFPGGSDEWETLGYKLERSKAVPMPEFINEQKDN